MSFNGIRRIQLRTAAAAAAVIWLLGGCGQRPDSSDTEQRTQTESQADTNTTEAATESEKQAETQELITSVDYMSKDGTIKITLPDNTWKVTQDADEMRVFQSGEAAIINIAHNSTETALKNQSVMTSEDELDASLSSQYTQEDDYEIVDYASAQVNDINIYRYTVKYNAAARMWAYSITYAIVADDQSYIVTGTVKDDNKTLLEAVRSSVESFQVLSDDELKAVTGTVLSGVSQETTESDTTADTKSSADAEMALMQTYGTSVTLETSDAVNVRAEPSTDAAILTALAKGTKVTATGESTNWFQVNVSGNTGYIRKDFLVYPTTDDTTAETTQETQAQTTGDSQSSAELSTATQYQSATTLYASAGVNVRSAPGTESSVINSLSQGSSVSVIGETDNWFIVSVGGTTGYVSKAYLTSTAPETTAETQAQTTAETTAETQAQTTSTASSATSLSGTVTSATVDVLTIRGDDGNSYTIYYGGANVNSSDGLYSGVYVSLSLDPSQAWGDGTLYATSVTGS